MQWGKTTAMNFKEGELIAIFFGSVAILHAFPFAWESHEINRCVEYQRQHLHNSGLTKNRIHAKAVNYCQGGQAGISP
ncbi:hypothetical protein SynBIOSE41_03736 [Synechococcus sp. BIOS-E4-1]|nr:hypothetical protein SynBIOSE41_03736 [Synechococcus sp. BIOS-E4-1]